MSDQNEVPAGFITLADPEANTRQFMIVDLDNWKHGCIVVYHGPREWTSAKGESRHVHTVAMDEDDGGALAGIWSTAVLDRLFKQVSVGERVYLRYDGVAPHASLSSRAVHQWTVARASSSVTPSAPKQPKFGQLI